MSEENNSARSYKSIADFLKASFFSGVLHRRELGNGLRGRQVFAVGWPKSRDVTTAALGAGPLPAQLSSIWPSPTPAEFLETNKTENSKK